MRSLFGDVGSAIAVGMLESDSEALLQAVRCLGMLGCDCLKLGWL